MSEASSEPCICNLSARQTASLQGVIDGLLPSLEPPEEYSQDAASRAFWKKRLARDADFMQVMDETITTKLPATESFLLCWLLSLLSTLIGTALVFGTLQPLYTGQGAFSQWTPSQQTAALKTLQLNQWKEKRKIFNGLKRLICGLAFSYIPPCNANNPFWEASGYPGPPPDLTEEQQEERLQKGGACDFRKDTEAFIEIKEDTKLSYDVVIVGSGAGGGVAAATLASKGYTVLVLEKGPYLSPFQVNYKEAESFDKMYESHGLLTTSDGNMMILAGSTLGGGTTINWSCCLPLPDHVRDEWVNQHGLTQFRKDQEFDMAMEAVVNRIGCKKDETCVTHNGANQKLIEGCKGLDYSWETTGQNLRSTEDDTAGYICFGDRYGNKQSGLVTFLADAVQHGAKMIENCRVEQILQGLYDAPGGRRRRKALGVVGRVGDYKVEVRARKCVISAAGALNTPCLLQRSWLRNPHIGRHLHLHPVAAASGFYKDTVIDCYRGAPMTTVCQEFQQGPNGDGYGAKIECPSAHSGLLATALQFISPEQYREHTMKLSHAAPLIVLQRDSSEGRVRLGGDGYSPKVEYAINDADKKSMFAALKGAIKILIASGASQVMTSHTNDPGLELSPTKLPRTRADMDDDAEIQQYLHQIDERGFRDHEMSVFAAHQMGSCRMGTSPYSSAVDENGETWEVDDLFVFDTSTFPTASGANPQMVVMAISRMLSTRLLLRFLHEDERLDSLDKKVSHAMDVLRLARLRVVQSNISPLTTVYFWFLMCLIPSVIVWYFWSPQIRLTERMSMMDTGEL